MATEATVDVAVATTNEVRGCGREEWYGLGIQQHYVPCFIIGNWGSRDALDLLPPKARPHAVRFCVDSGDGRRKRYVCVFSKATRKSRATQAHKLFCRKHVYSLPEYENPLKRGMMFAMFGQFLGLPLLDNATRDEFIAFGSHNIKRTAPEDYLQKLESVAAGRLDSVVDMGHIRREDRLLVERFLGFSFMRTPAWQEAFQQDSVAAAHNSAINRLGGHGSRELWLLAEEIMGDTAHIWAALNIEAHPSLFQYVSNLRVDVVRAVGKVGFVLGDNPVWPFRYSCAEHLDDLPWVGLDEHTDAIGWYPLTPRVGLRVSSGRKPGLVGHRAFGDRQVRRINTAVATLSRDDVVFPNANFDNCLLRPISTIPPWRKVA